MTARIALASIRCMRRVCWPIIVGLITGAGGVTNAQAPVERPPDEPVLTAPELFATPDAMSDGAIVRLDGVVIRAKSGNVLRVSVARHEIFVVPADPSTLNFLTIGARVDVQGTLRRP